MKFLVLLFVFYNQLPVNTVIIFLHFKMFYIQVITSMNLIYTYSINIYSNMTSFFRFVDKRAIYRWYNLIHTCAGEYDWLFYWQHKLCATFSTSINIKHRLPIKVYYRICTLRHIRIENHGSQNVFWVLTWVGGY
jgi:hypothetical protein